jgi:hypothetical protein
VRRRTEDRGLRERAVVRTRTEDRGLREGAAVRTKIEARWRGRLCERGLRPEGGGAVRSEND